jgi:hypothetical protein
MVFTGDGVGLLTGVEDSLGVAVTAAASVIDVAVKKMINIREKYKVIKNNFLIFIVYPLTAL